jgi:hypothetical protein
MLAVDWGEALIVHLADLFNAQFTSGVFEIGHCRAE